ncbi:unnamed protein product [Chondrus crispus]|uniref:Uncharacterized protein n=1 Tax=Chondrus crispus TaxID=2769 RepID=R7Q4H9_CHOCR|nr:unnamed protein product [Chondrus crispus]CDF33427.1 unnamed protein product [Chondrus crispus]|eukprot:XP_005713230.1 unnamed protein product [Chondrus crispus]
MTLPHAFVSRPSVYTRRRPHSSKRVACILNRLHFGALTTSRASELLVGFHQEIAPRKTQFNDPTCTAPFRYQDDQHSSGSGKYLISTQQFPPVLLVSFGERRREIFKFLIRQLSKRSPHSPSPTNSDYACASLFPYARCVAQPPGRGSARHPSMQPRLPPRKLPDEVFLLPHSLLAAAHVCR